MKNSYFKLILVLLTGSLFVPPAFSQPGSIDSTFNSTDKGFGNGDGASHTIYTTAVQSDGKIIIGGEFTTYNGTARNRLARLNADGTLDETFNSGANSWVYATAIQSDGKIIIGGRFNFYNGTRRNFVARLNADGTLDGTFDPGTAANGDILTIAIQSNGKIIIGGKFTSYNGTSRNCIARLNADGTLDQTFNPGTGANSWVFASAIQSDGKIIIGGRFTSYNGTVRYYIARLNADGTLDGTFNPGTGANGFIQTTTVQSDGKIIIGGTFSTYNGTGRNRIARLNADGTLDATFNPGTGANSLVYTSAIQSDGKIIIGGDFKFYNGTARNRIARLNADGTLDETFNPGATVAGEEGVEPSAFITTTIYTTAIQSDGKIIIAGAFYIYNLIERNNISRLKTDGTHDRTFNQGVGANSWVHRTAIQSDGKIIIVGDFTTYNGTGRSFVARLNADGTLDASFNPGTGANAPIFSTAIQSDGKIIIGGLFTSYNGTARNGIARLNTDGTLDANFDPGTRAYNFIETTAIQKDGKIIIGGTLSGYNGTARTYFARLNTDGTLDAGFNLGTGPNSQVNTTAIQSDGKIIIDGTFNSYNGTAIIRIARLNPDGTLDGTFDPGTAAFGDIQTIAIQSDGKILIGGWFDKYNGTARNRIARLNSDGSLDVTFNPGTGANGSIQTIAIQSDGKIIIGGDFKFYNGTVKNGFARLNADGTLDTTFNRGTGANNSIQTTAILSDGKIIIGGKFTSYNGTGRNRIARIKIDHAPVITSSGGGTTANKSIEENTTFVVQVAASGSSNTYSISGGIDQSYFTINPSSGVLSFITAPDFENPADFGKDNVYVVTVRASNANGSGEQTITVTVTDVNDNAREPITVFPNPVVSNTISLRFNSLEKGRNTVTLTNKLGQRLYRSVIDHPGGSSTQTLKISSYLPKGTYQLQVMGAEVKTVQQLIVR